MRGGKEEEGRQQSPGQGTYMKNGLVELVTSHDSCFLNVHKCSLSSQAVFFRQAVQVALNAL